MGKTKSKEFSELPEIIMKPEVEESKSSKNKLIKAYNYLKEHYDFRYNVITFETEYKPKDEPDSEYKFFDDTAYHDIDQEVALKAASIAERNFKNWVYGSKLSKHYDPFKTFIFNLPGWDGKDYIEEWLRQIELADEEQRDFFIDCVTRWFIAYVASLVVDQLTNQTCLVLVGEQGKYKTTLLNSIVPPELKLDYLYASTFIAHNKDHEKYLATKMLINLDEMQAFNRSDIESIKSKITQDKIELRLPYAKADIKAWRRASFVGSVNRDEFLNDATGSRRFLPFKIKKITYKKDYDIKPLYSQAYKLFKEGRKYWFDSEDIERLERHNDPHKDKTMEEEYVLQHFRKPTKEDISKGSCEYLLAGEIMDIVCKKHEKMNANNTVKRNIGIALQMHGYDKVPMRRNGKPLKLWCVQQTDKQITEFEDGSPLPFDTDLI